MPGGIIQPDGRPKQAPGIGKTAKRHDLEGTPGLHNSSLQQGDVKMLSEGQKALKPKTVQKPAQKQPKGGNQNPRPRSVPVPDAIDFIGGRGAGTFDPNTVGDGQSQVDAERWRPLLQQLARNPMASGPLTTQIMEQLGNMNRAPQGPTVDVIDMNAAEDALALQLGVE